MLVIFDLKKDPLRFFGDMFDIADSCSGVRSLLFFTSIIAPYCNNNFTTSSRPFATERCNGVSPSSFLLLISAPFK